MRGCVAVKNQLPAVNGMVEFIAKERVDGEAVLPEERKLERTLLLPVLLLSSYSSHAPGSFDTASSSVTTKNMWTAASTFVNTILQRLTGVIGGISGNRQFTVIVDEFL